jgi:hypothetical protein
LLPVDVEGTLDMTLRIRLLLLVLAIAYSAVFGTGHALGGEKRGFTHKLKTPWLRLHRPHLPRPKSAAPLGERAARYARHLLGVPYRYGGDSPRSGFDCSGFVRYVYAHFGVSLPHSSYDGARRLIVKKPRLSVRPRPKLY